MRQEPLRQRRATAGKLGIEHEMLGVHGQMFGRVLQFIGVRTTVTEVVVTTAQMPGLALPPGQITPACTARPVRAATVCNMGQLMHQSAASRAAGAGHGIIQQLATQGDVAGESAAVYIGRQVIAPAYLDLCRQCSQQAIRQQRPHVGQGLVGELLLCRVQPCRVELKAIGCVRGVGDQQ